MNLAHLSALLLLSALLGSSAVPAHAQAQPAAPREPGKYLPVEDVPKREDPAMSPDARAKLVNELKAARDRQAHLKPKDGTKPGKP